MERLKCHVVLGLLMGLFFVAACQSNDNIVMEEDPLWFRDTTLVSIIEESNPNLTIHQGLVSQKEQNIRLMRDGEAVAIVKLSEPKIIAQALEEEEWGYFQFPIIYRDEADNSLIVNWQMRADAISEYGNNSVGQIRSRDEGSTWETITDDYFQKGRYRVELKNGDIIQIYTPAAKDVMSYSEFPSPVNSNPISSYNFYRETEVPEELQGIYLQFWKKSNNKFTFEHCTIDDPGLLRYAANNLMPVFWGGYIKEIEDGSLVSGVYGGYYQNSRGDVLRGGLSFYKSDDFGKNWKIIGKIPYQVDERSYESYVFDGNPGFTESAFEILKDGTYLCIMRTDNFTPMYKSFSKDCGQHWSIPEPMAPNGVKPNLLFLENGVLVLASGRPGVQLRFCLDGDGIIWTEPLEMMPFMDENGQFPKRMTKWESCGYPHIMKAGNNSFYIVYSDFKTKNVEGEYRKAIIFRKIEVITR